MQLACYNNREARLVDSPGVGPLRLPLAAATIALVSLAFFPALCAAQFELKDGDRVVLLGSTLIEREQRYGYWETALTARWPQRQITFRNLGWSGDTVWGDARAGFDKPSDGYQRLLGLTRNLRPTVIFFCYGTNESFTGPAGLAAFEKQYAHLLDDLAPLKARMVLFSPTPFEKAPALPDPATRNADLVRYRDAIKELASKRKLVFADLFAQAPAAGGPHTDNGMHPSEQGFRALTPAFERALGLSPPVPPSSELEPLRQTIVDKNRLFFYRWRPQNETYLFGFRKHEQGKNAKEVAEFDPLVAEKEKEITRLRSAAGNLPN
jgi:lysophospholipase L1-like esterase